MLGPANLWVPHSEKHFAGSSKSSGSGDFVESLSIPIFGPVCCGQRLDQDAIWYVSRPRPRTPGGIVLDGNPVPPQKGGTAAPTLFGHVLSPNGWMDQGATCYGGRPWPRPHCVIRWGPRSPSQKSGTASRPNLRPMSEGPGSPRPERGTAVPPLFGPCLL